MEQTTKRSVKINIPEFVDEYMSSNTSGDIEDCYELEQHFYKVYSRMSSDLKRATQAFLERYIIKNRIDPQKDLGGVFNALNLKLN